MENIVANILFYSLAAVSVSLALSVVLTRRILRAAVYLMGVLVMSAGFFLMLEAEFLAGVQILVYVGGIVVLLVFAVMLTRSVELLEEVPAFGRKVMAFLVAAAFFGMTVWLFQGTDFTPIMQGSMPVENTAAIGRKLLDAGEKGYVLPFEIISLLLLAALIGGSLIARKAPKKQEKTHV